MKNVRSVNPYILPGVLSRYAQSLEGAGTVLIRQGRRRNRDGAKAKLSCVWIFVFCCVVVFCVCCFLSWCCVCVVFLLWCWVGVLVVCWFLLSCVVCCF